MYVAKVNADMIELENDVWKYMRAYTRAYIHEAADAAVGFAKDAIEQFYKNYDPRSYRRTYNLEGYSYERHYENRWDKNYRGGVCITSKNMDPYVKYVNHHPIDIDPYPIAKAAWLQGMHGWPKAAQIDSDNPVHIVSTKLNDKQNLNKFHEKALQVARSKKYNVLSFG